MKSLNINWGKSGLPIGALFSRLSTWFNDYVIKFLGK